MLFEDKRLAPYHGKEPFLFLSYSHKDAEEAAEVILRFKQAGFRVWYDEGVIPATEWDEKIARAINRSSYFVSLISEAYLASANCLDELNYARDLNKPQLLIYLQDVSLPEGLAMRLGRQLAVYKNRFDDPDAFYARIFRAKGIKVCRGEPIPVETDSYAMAGTTPEPERYVTPSTDYFTGRLITLLVAVMLLVTALLAWHYRTQLSGLFSDLRYSHSVSQQTSEPAPIPEIVPDPTPAAVIEDNTADIIPDESPSPVVTPAPTTTPTPTLTPTPTPTPAPTPTPTPADTVVVVDEPSGGEDGSSEGPAPDEGGPGGDDAFVVDPVEASPSPSPDLTAEAETGA